VRGPQGASLKNAEILFCLLSARFLSAISAVKLFLSQIQAGFDLCNESRRSAFKPLNADALSASISAFSDFSVLFLVRY
jgi:hypothetical protein